MAKMVLVVPQSKEMQRKVLCEEIKGSILTLLAEGYCERWVAPILKILSNTWSSNG